MTVAGPMIPVHCKTLCIAGILMLLVIGVPAASASTVTIDSRTFMGSGDTGTVDIILDEAPNGLAGYSFDISISDPQVAEITGITKPSWFDGLWSRQVVSSAENSLAAVDIDQTNTPPDPDGNIKPGDTSIRLATVSIRAISGGTAVISLTNEELDSDRPAINQGIITTTLVPGTLQVPADNGTIPVRPTPSEEKDQKGSIRVTSTPSGAEIFINGAHTGQKTPQVFADQAVGSYEVYVTLDGYLTPPSISKSVKHNTQTLFAFSLSNSSTDTGSIRVTSKPFGAAIFMNGIDTGKTTPVTWTKKYIGSYDVYVTLEGYVTPPVQTKSVTKDTRTTFEFILTEAVPDSGSMTVTSVPPAAEIFIDGVDTGKQTPFTFTEQPAGRYEVYPVLDGYEIPAPQAKSVARGMKTTFEFALQQFSVPVKVKILPNRLVLKNNGYVIAFITLPASYTAIDVDESSVVCDGASALRLIRSTSAPRNFVAVFKRQDLVKVNHGDQVKVTVTGTVQSNGRTVVFKGSDFLKVV